MKLRGAPKRAGTDGYLRVAVVTDGFYPWFKGGKEVRFHELLTRVAAKGVAIDVYTMQWWDGPRDRQEGSLRLHAICGNRPMYAGERRSLVQAVIFAVACLRLVTVEADVIDADHMPYLQIFPLWVVCWIRGIPLVLTWHEWWGAAYWRSYLGPIGILAAGVERLVARLADQLVVAAEGTAERMVAAGIPPRRIVVLPSGVHAGEIAGAPSSQTSYDVLYVGRLLEHKGVDVLVQGLAELAKGGVVLRCGIVGEGPQRGALEAAVLRLGLQGHVDFLGRLETKQEVFGLIKSAGVFVLPSRREGFGIVVAEALACGTPVVTTDHVDNLSRHLVNDGITGCLAAPTPGGLAAALIRALDTVGRGDALRASAAIRDWDELALDLVGVYSQQIGS